LPRIGSGAADAQQLQDVALIEGQQLPRVILNAVKDLAGISVSL
jgi:hypothetical protein